MTPLRPHPVTAALNHVLRSAPLAMQRLRRFAGRTVGVDVGPVALAFTVQTTGELAPAVTGAARDLDVRISPFLLPRLAVREEAAFGEIQMHGDPDLAAEVRYLARHLSWDAEEDLSRVVGDIAAHRIAGAGRAIRDWSADAAARVAQGAAEYWTEEKPLIASRVRVDAFRREVTELEAAIERLEQRLARLD